MSFIGSLTTGYAAASLGAKIGAKKAQENKYETKQDVIKGLARNKRNVNLLAGATTVGVLAVDSHKNSFATKALAKVWDIGAHKVNNLKTKALNTKVGKKASEIVGKTSAKTVEVAKKLFKKAPEGLQNKVKAGLEKAVNYCKSNPKAAKAIGVIGIVAGTIAGVMLKKNADSGLKEAMKEQFSFSSKNEKE